MSLLLFTDHCYGVFDHCYSVSNHWYSVFDHWYIVFDHCYSVTNRCYIVFDRCYSIFDCNYSILHCCHNVPYRFKTILCPYKLPPFRTSTTHTIISTLQPLYSKFAQSFNISSVNNRWIHIILSTSTTSPTTTHNNPSLARSTSLNPPSGTPPMLMTRSNRSTNIKATILLWKCLCFPSDATDSYRCQRRKPTTQEERDANTI